MSLPIGLLLGTAASTRKHRGWIKTKQNNNKQNETKQLGEVQGKPGSQNGIGFSGASFPAAPACAPQVLCSGPTDKYGLQYKAQLAANLDLAISHLQARDSKPNTRAPSYFPTQKQFKTDLTPM